MKKREQVSKIMTTSLITVNLSNQVSEVAELFNEKNIRHIPVVSGKTLIGMISKNDIERISFVTDRNAEKVSAQVYNNISIGQVMTDQLDVVQIDAEIRDAAKLLAKGYYNALPVLKGKELEGIVTTTDVINYLLEQY